MAYAEQASAGHAELRGTEMRDAAAGPTPLTARAAIGFTVAASLLAWGITLGLIASVV
jgi:hypothetical protein